MATSSDAKSSVSNWPMQQGASSVGAAALLFSLTAVCVKQSQLSNLVVVMVPSILCTALTGALIFASKKPTLPSTSVVTLLAFRSLLNCCAVFCFYYAAQSLTLGAAVTIFFSYPVLVAILERSVPATKADLAAGTACLLMLAGVGLVSQRQAASADETTLLGHAASSGAVPVPAALVHSFTPSFIGVGLALAGAGCAAASFICMRELGQRASALQVAFGHHIAVTVTTSIMVLAGYSGAPSWGDVMAAWPLLLAMVATQFLGHLLFTYGVQRSTASSAATLSATQVLFTYYWSVVLFQQSASALGGLGALLMVLGALAVLYPVEMRSILEGSKVVSWMLDTISATSAEATCTKKRGAMQCCGSGCCSLPAAKRAHNSARSVAVSSVHSASGVPEQLTAAVAATTVPSDSSTPVGQVPPVPQQRVSFSPDTAEVSKSYGQLTFSVKQVPEQESTASLATPRRPSILDLSALPKAWELDESVPLEEVLAFRACSSHNTWARSCPHPNITGECPPMSPRCCPDDPNAEEHPGYMRCRSHTEWSITRILVPQEPVAIRFQDPPPLYSPRLARPRSPLTAAPAVADALPQPTLDSGAIAAKHQNTGFQMVRKTSVMDMDAAHLNTGFQMVRKTSVVNMDVPSSHSGISSGFGTTLVVNDDEELPAGWKVFRQTRSEDLASSADSGVSQDLLIEQLEAAADSSEGEEEVGEGGAVPQSLKSGPGGPPSQNLGPGIVKVAQLASLVIPPRSDLSMTDLALLSPHSAGEQGAHTEAPVAALPASALARGDGMDDGAEVPEGGLSPGGRTSKYCHWSVKRLTSPTPEPEHAVFSQANPHPVSPPSAKYSSFGLKRLSAPGETQSDLGSPFAPTALAFPDGEGISFDAARRPPSGATPPTAPDPPKTPPSPDLAGTNWKAARIHSSPSQGTLLSDGVEAGSSGIGRSNSDGVLPPRSPAVPAQPAGEVEAAAKPKYKVAGPYQPWKITRISSDGSSVDIRESRQSSGSGEVDGKPVQVGSTAPGGKSHTACGYLSTTSDVDVEGMPGVQAGSTVLAASHTPRAILPILELELNITHVDEHGMPGVQVYVHPDRNHSDAGMSDGLDSPFLGSPDESLLAEAVRNDHAQLMFAGA